MQKATLKIQTLITQLELSLGYRRHYLGKGWFEDYDGSRYKYCICGEPRREGSSCHCSDTWNFSHPNPLHILYSDGSHLMATDAAQEARCLNNISAV